jgi:hypothetical protein
MSQDLFQEFQEASEVQADQITLKQLDDLIAQLKQAREEYDEKKKLATEANNKCEALENTLMDILEKLGKTSYTAEGVAKVTRVSKLVFRVPANGEQKKDLFKYISSKYGEDALLGLSTINHQTLNSWANRELAEANVGQIPGLEAPTSVDYLQVRKA